MVQQNITGETPAFHPEIRIPTLWVLVADTSVVKFFVRRGRRFGHMHSIYRQKDLDAGLTNDTVGRGAGFSGVGRHKFDPSMQESRQEQIRLAQDAAWWLEHSAKLQKYDQLVLVAAPEMLGELRKALTKPVLATIISETSKALVNHDESKLTDELLKLVPGPDYEDRHAT